MTRKRPCGNSRRPCLSASRSARSSDEFNERKTRESLICHDADQLALIYQLKEYGDLGNKYSREWINFAKQRLYTENAKAMAEKIIQTDSSDWWFKDKSDWWVNGSNRQE